MEVVAGIKQAAPPLAVDCCTLLHFAMLANREEPNNRLHQRLARAGERGKGRAEALKQWDGLLSAVLSVKRLP